jgi:hypothetical protein
MGGRGCQRARKQSKVLNLFRFILTRALGLWWPTGAQYVALHLKFWMRCSGHMQWIHWKILVTLKTSHLPGHRGVLQESNKYSQIIFIDCSVYDWLDSLIDLGGMLLALSHLFAVPIKFYGWGWK